MRFRFESISGIAVDIDRVQDYLNLDSAVVRVRLNLSFTSEGLLPLTSPGKLAFDVLLDAGS